MTEPTDRSRAGDSLSDYLERPQCKVDLEFRTNLLAQLRRHEIVIWGREGLYDFNDRYPHYFRPITPEERARGLDTVKTVADKYLLWIRPLYHQYSLTGEITCCDRHEGTTVIVRHAWRLSGRY